MAAADGGNSVGGQFPFPVRFKGSLNIFVAAAGLRLLLCRFCVFPLPGWAIPVGCSGWEADAMRQGRGFTGWGSGGQR